MTQNPPKFDVAQDYIDEAIELSEIALNYYSGEGMRAHDQPAPQVIEPVKAVQERPIKHGTSHAYNRRGCRCEVCREANSVRRKADRAKAKARRAAERSRKRRERDFAKWHTRQCRCPECVRVPGEVAR